MKKQFLEAAGVKTDKEFYEKYPTEESFFNAHPEMRHLLGVSRMRPPAPVIQFLEAEKERRGINHVYEGKTPGFKGTLQEFFQQNAPVGTRIRPDYKGNFAFPHSKKKSPNKVLPVGRGEKYIEEPLDNAPIVDITGVQQPEDYSSHKTFGEAFKAARKDLGPGGTFTWKGKTYGTQLKGEAPTKPTIDPGMAYNYAAITGSLPALAAQSNLGAPPVVTRDLLDAYYSGGNVPEGYHRMPDGTMMRDSDMYQYGGPAGPTADEFYNFGVPPIGPMAFYAAGGGINIDPSKRGTFTAAATKHGKGVQEFASQVLANPDNYSPAMVKKANFARNAAKWKKQEGGETDFEKYYMRYPSNWMGFTEERGMAPAGKDFTDYTDWRGQPMEEGASAKGSGPAKRPKSGKAPKKQAGGTITNGVPYSTDEVNNINFDNVMGYIRDNNMNNLSNEVTDYFKCGGTHKRMQFGGDENPFGEGDPYGYKGTAKYEQAANMAYDQANIDGGYNFPSYMAAALGSVNPYWQWKGSVNDQKFKFNTEMPQAQFGKNIRDMFSATPPVDPSSMPAGSANIQQYKYKAGLRGQPRKVKLRGQFNFGANPAMSGDPADPFSGTTPGPWSPEYMDQMQSQVGYTPNMMSAVTPPWMAQEEPQSMMDRFRDMKDYERGRKRGERQDFRATAGMNRLYNKGLMFDERMKDRYFNEDLREEFREEDYPLITTQKSIDRYKKGRRKSNRRAQRREPFTDELYSSFKVGGEHQWTEDQINQFLQAGGQVEYL